MSSWIPQNIQKRLLLYVLHQLSLFSEIDLPNLSVSLGTQSQITLHDVELDTEKISVPGLFIRSGKIGELTLRLTVTGGVSVCADGIEITMAPAPMNGSNNAMFSLAQSTADLATSVMIGGDDESVPMVDATIDESPKSSGGGKLNGVMARAAEMALARLVVKLRNIKIKVIADQTVFEFQIKTVSCDSDEGTRNVKIDGIDVILVKPSVFAGNEDEKDEETEEIDETKAENSDESSDYDSDDEQKQSSLMDSMMFSHEDAMFMSANSTMYKSTQERDSSIRLVYVDTLRVSFTGLTELSNLEVDVGEIKVAMTPIPPVLVGLFNSLSRLQRFRRASSRDDEDTEKQEDSDEQDDEEEPARLFNRLHISRIILSLTSALSAGGRFSSRKSVNLNLENIKIKSKSNDLVYGGIETVELTKNETETVFHYEDNSEPDEVKKRADLRFEIKNKNQITLLCSKRANMTLDLVSVGAILRFGYGLDPVIKAFKKISVAESNLNGKKTKGSSQFILQTSLIVISVVLDAETTIKTTILPISFNLIEGILNVSKILIGIVADSNEEGQEDNLVKFGGISINFNNKEVKSFDHHNRETIVNSPVSFEIDSTNVTCSLVQLDKLSSTFSHFANQLPDPHNNITSTKPSASVMDYSNISSNRKVRMSSTIFQHHQSILLHVMLKKVGFNIGISDNFGAINGSLNSIGLDVFNDRKMVNIMRMNANRIWKDELNESESVEESVIDMTTENLKNGSPVISLNIRNSSSNMIDIALRNVVISYNVGWDLSIIRDNEAEKTSSSSSTPRINVKTYNTIAKISPLNLDSQLIFDVKNSNILIEQETKVTLNGISLFILDTQTYSKGARPVRIAYLNYLNVGVNKNKDITALSLNCDNLEAEFCSDSFHCFIQTLTNFREFIPIEFSEKFKTESDQMIDMFGDIDLDGFKAKSGIIHNEGETSSSVNFSLASYKSEEEHEGDIVTEFEFNEDHFDDNEVVSSNQQSDSVGSSPPISFSSSVSVNKITISLYDGFDFNSTRKVLRKSITKLENRLMEYNEQEHSEYNENETGRLILNETLFESIHVSVPVGTDPLSLTKRINDELNGKDSSPPPTRTSHGTVASPSPDIRSISSGHSQSHSQSPNPNIHGIKNVAKLRLNRSKKSKVTIVGQELSIATNVYNSDEQKNGASATLDTDDSELMNTTTVRLHDIQIIDNVPTSTWNKFLVYMRSSGERESGVDMVSATVSTVKPMQNLSATELILDISILPIRLHVDQDTLDFLTRFGEFRDDRFSLPMEDDIVFIQKFNINPVQVKLDYKPKKVDYAGIRSGHTTEFMNFFILDEAEMMLKRATVYGISGFPKLGKILNGIWMPDIKSTQLGGILAGLAPVRSIVNIGFGMKDLVAIPIKEYKKDGRIMRSLQKGVFAFAKTTSSELLKFGIKLTNGTQTLLETTEEALGGDGSSARLNNQNSGGNGGINRRNTSSSTSRLRRGSVDEDEEIVFAITDKRRLSDGSGASKRKNSITRPQLIGRGALGRESFGRRSSRTQEDDEEYYGHGAQHIDKSRYQLLLQKKQQSLHRDDAVTGDEDDFDSEEEDPEEDSDGYIDEDGKDNDDERQKVVSLYADQPENVSEGLQLAYDSLGRNFVSAREAVVKAGSVASESGSAQGAATALAKAAPVMIIRPIIGATEAVSKTLLGFNNYLDPEQRLDSQEKYKTPDRG